MVTFEKVACGVHRFRLGVPKRTWIEISLPAGTQPSTSINFNRPVFFRWLDPICEKKPGCWICVLTTTPRVPPRCCFFSPENERMSPENQWLEDVFPIEIVPFLGDMLVFRGVFARRLGLENGHPNCSWMLITICTAQRVIISHKMNVWLIYPLGKNPIHGSYDLYSCRRKIKNSDDIKNGWVWANARFKHVWEIHICWVFQTTISPNEKVSPVIWELNHR